MSVPSKGKALKFAKHGDPSEALSVEEVSVATPGDDEICVKMLAAPINPSDALTVTGLYPLQPSDGVGGHEGVGEVVATGASVRSVSVGDRVVPLASGQGTWRTYGTFKAEKWLKVDSKVPLHDAATLLVNPGTALSMLNDFVDLQPGMVVMQNGGNSEVGKFVIKMAAQKGVKTINIVRDRPNWKETVDQLTALGATLVATPDTVQEKAREANLEPILALNCVGGGEVVSTMIDMMANQGTFVTYGVMAGDPISMSAVPFIFKDLRMRGFWISKWSNAAQSSDAMKDLLLRLQGMILEGTISSKCKEVPLADWKQAFGKDFRGKALLMLQ